MDSFSRVQGFRIQTLIIEAYPLGDLCLGEIWVGLLGFLPRIHTEEVEGGLVGLGCIGVLGFISMHLHRQRHCQHATAQTDTLSACICTDRQTHSQHASAQTDTLSACICTERHTVRTRCKLRCQKGCINVYTKGFCHHALSQLPSLGNDQCHQTQGMYVCMIYVHAYDCLFGMQEYEQFCRSVS